MQKALFVRQHNQSNLNMNITPQEDIYLLCHNIIPISIMHLLNTFTWDLSSNTKPNRPPPDNLQTNYVDNEMRQPTGNC